MPQEPLPSSGAPRRWPKFFRQPLDDVLATLEPVVTTRGFASGMLPLLAIMIAAWFIYVPIHEMLHVFGCVAAGGTVSELEIKPQYGGTILAQYFDFVTPGGSYGGRLSGFDTHGSDLTYLSTVFMPFVLSIVPGVALLWLCTRRARPFLAGPALLLALAPFYNLPGDYHEMGSILVTRTLSLLAGGVDPPMFEKLRSDDVFALLGTYVSHPAELNLHGPVKIIMGGGVILASVLTAALLAFATYWCGTAVARAIVGAPRPPTRITPPPRRVRRRRPASHRDAPSPFSGAASPRE
ncbi:MAG: hypothetical protein J5J06_03980 [Phycisphaerae bacterium]|nr:hypothetical protein [Phycisphaerae bacterium]